MADYQKMYTTLFRAITKTITLLQEAQQVTEELYISTEKPAITVLRKPGIDNSDNE